MKFIPLCQSSLVFLPRSGYPTAGFEQFPKKGVRMRPGLYGWLLLLGLFLGIPMVWGLARWITPYDVDGTPRALSTHTQLGLPPCTFLVVTGLPCPSCGLTTSFSLMVHGDPFPSFRANPAGPILLLFTLFVWFWSLWCMMRRQLFWSRVWEFRLVLLLGGVFLLLLIKWLLFVVFPRLYGT